MEKKYYVAYTITKGNEVIYLSRAETMEELEENIRLFRKLKNITDEIHIKEKYFHE